MLKLCLRSLSFDVWILNFWNRNTLSPPNSRFLGPRKWPRIWNSRIWSSFYIVNVIFGGQTFPKSTLFGIFKKIIGIGYLSQIGSNFWNSSLFGKQRKFFTYEYCGRILAHPATKVPAPLTTFYWGFYYLSVPMGVWDLLITKRIKLS